MKTMKPESLIQALLTAKSEHPAPVGTQHQSFLRRLDLISAGCPPKMPGKYIR